MAININNEQKKYRNKTINNTNSDRIVITRDKLHVKLSRHFDKLKHQRDWIGAISLCISISLTLLTSDFKKVLNIDPLMWRGIFIMFLIFAIIYTIYTIYKAFKSLHHNIDDVIDDIFKPD